MLNYIHAWPCNTRDLLPTEKTISNHCYYIAVIVTVASCIP